MSIAVKVEVSDQLTQTESGKQKQVVYVHTGKKYPEPDEIWVNNGSPRKPGMYVAQNFYKKRYDWVLDLSNLQELKA